MKRLIEAIAAGQNDLPSIAVVIYAIFDTYFTHFSKHHNKHCTILNRHFSSWFGLYRNINHGEFMYQGEGDIVSKSPKAKLVNVQCMKV